MANWVRYRLNGKTEIGVISGGLIQPYEGEFFDNPQATGDPVNRNEVDLLTPCQPASFLGLWNNFYSRAQKEGWDIPAEPLYFSKLSTSILAHNENIIRPPYYTGPINFEGELGIVIGKSCYQIDEQQADDSIFGYTCVNDVTAKEILHRDSSFPQWTRAKGFNTFGVFGPGIVTDIEPDELIIESILDGEIKQKYSVSDMIFKPRKLVATLSKYMRLMPGCVIACGTGPGACAMEDGQTIEINIEGIGRLSNTMNG